MDVIKEDDGVQSVAQASKTKPMSPEAKSQSNNGIDISSPRSGRDNSIINQEFTAEGFEFNEVLGQDDLSKIMENPQIGEEEDAL